GVPAALLLACPPAYVLLLSALPPPLYPTTLVLLAAVMALAVREAESLRAGRPSSSARLALMGALGGLAVWTHLMSLATLGAVAAVLFGVAWRARARRALGWALVPFLVLSAPSWIRAVGEPSATAVLEIAHEGAAPLAHAETVAAHLHQPVSALLVAWTPLTADEGEGRAAAPAPVRALLVAGWIVAAAAGVLALRGRPAALLLAGAVVLTVAAFPFPVRSDAHTVRFLTPAL